MASVTPDLWAEKILPGLHIHSPQSSLPTLISRSVELLRFASLRFTYNQVPRPTSTASSLFLHFVKMRFSFAIVALISLANALVRTSRAIMSWCVYLYTTYTHADIIPLAH